MRKKRGDRKDGAWVRDIDGVHAMFPYLMPNRCEAEAYLQEEVDVTALLAYLAEKNAALDYKITPFHAFVTAMAKTIILRPHLNRFIAGRRYYQRNEITLSFIVKRAFKDGSEEILFTMKAENGMTLQDISQNILGRTGEIRKEGGGNDMKEFLDAMQKLPRFLLSFITSILRWLDFYGLVPSSICEGDTNYSTVLLSNLGSIKGSAAYHHLNNYGTNSLVVTIGTIHKAQVLDADGKAELRDVVTLGVTADERIADGFYYAKSIMLFKHIINNPSLLERPLEENVDFEY